MAKRPKAPGESVPAAGASQASAEPADQQQEKRFFKRYERACRRFDRVRSTIDEAYEFELPLRDRSTDTKTENTPTMDRLFDSTAVGAIQDFASMTVDDVWPANQAPFELRAGSEIKDEERGEADRIMASVAADIIETINNSNFISALHEASLDYAIATGFLLPEAGDALEPVRFRALPLVEARPDLGPFGTIDALFWDREVDAGDITVVWPDAKLPDDLQKIARDKPDQKVCVVEGFERDWKVRGTETWLYRAAWKDKKKTLVTSKREGDGSHPFIPFSRSRVAGEVLGRGPGLLALPDIKTLNLVMQFILENADLAISGAWLVDDDGQINPDTAVVAPGSMIPRTPGRKGMEPLHSGADFQLGDWLVENLQQSILKLFQQDALGRPDKTPFSAAEAQIRDARDAKKQSGPHARLRTELLVPVVRSVAWIRKQQGAIKLPAIDGRTVKIIPMTPFSRQQATDEVMRHERWRATLAQLAGPQLAAIISDDEKLADFLARKQGIDPSIIRSIPERKQLRDALAQMAQQAAAPGTEQAA